VRTEAPRGDEVRSDPAAREHCDILCVDVNPLDQIERCGCPAEQVRTRGTALHEMHLQFRTSEGDHQRGEAAARAELCRKSCAGGGGCEESSGMLDGIRQRLRTDPPALLDVREDTYEQWPRIRHSSA
jgi:hypothetical protein